MNLLSSFAWLIALLRSISTGYEPVAGLASLISVYWLTVLSFVLYKRIRFGLSAGLWPKKAKERRLWLIIGPVVLGWIALPWVSLGWPETVALQINSGMLTYWPMTVIRWAAIGLAVLFYLQSLRCWLQMGKNWSMAIVPGQKTELVTHGLYAWMRHPIYAFSLGLMLCSVVILPTWPMLLLAAMHCLAMNRKARYEEIHLEQQFGPAYTLYCAQVGRFWPKLGALRKPA